MVGLLSARIAASFRDEVLTWRQRAVTNPENALRRAETWLAEGIRDPECAVLARHVACLAAVERGNLDDARHYAASGLETAASNGLFQRDAELRLSLAWIELEQGNTSTCREHLEASRVHLRGSHAARAQCLRGLLHYQSGSYQEAISELTDALLVLRGDADAHWVANALVARGAAHLYRNAVDEAEADLLDAEKLFTAEGNTARAAACRHNRGYAAFRAGDVPRALRLFSEAQERGLDTESHPETRVDRAEALAAAGMNTQARAELERAAERLAILGRAVRLAETQLALSGCALRAGDTESAVNWACQADQLFRQQRRPAWSALAVAAGWQGKLAAGSRSRQALLAARRAAAECAGYGWHATAADLRLSAGRAALEAGMPGIARKLLSSAAVHRDDPAATAPQRALGWLAEALLAQHADLRADVFEACRNGLRLIEGHASAMPSFELRVHAFGLAAELADLAIGTALAVGDPRLVLKWTERYRANALNRRTMRPPEDPALRNALVELRATVAAARDSAELPDPKSALAKVAELERQVRDRAMLVEGTTKWLSSTRQFERVYAELGDAVLISYFVHNGVIHAGVIADARISLFRLTPENDIAEQLEQLQRALSRRAEASSERIRAAFAGAARRSAELIEDTLLRPMLPILTDGRPLVVVPTGELHALAWAELPSCLGRSVTVAPSLRCWLRGAADSRYRRHGNHQVWIAGPGLDHAQHEVRALQAVSGGRLLLGGEASADEVLATVDGASTVHIAAHGWFRDDQPLLSCLDLADGPLFGYDFDQLETAPSTVVLSACEVGRCAVSRGGEISGLAAALLGRGTSTLIASVAPVPDQRTADVMMALHAGLRRGIPPAAALAQAQAEYGESSFICLGYGGGQR